MVVERINMNAWKKKAEREAISDATLKLKDAKQRLRKLEARRKQIPLPYDTRKRWPIFGQITRTKNEISNLEYTVRTSKSKFEQNVYIYALNYVRGKKLNANEIMFIIRAKNFDELSWTLLVRILEQFQESKEILSEIIERNLQLDIYGKPDFSTACNIIEKNSKNSFYGDEQLVARIYITLGKLEVESKPLDQRGLPASTLEIGRSFELVCEEMLRDAGYRVKRTSDTGDYGIDLIAEIPEYSVGVQCKDHTKPVGIRAIQETVSGISYYSLDYGVVVSKSGFTPRAREFAARNELLAVKPEVLSHIDILLKNLK